MDGRYQTRARRLGSLVCRLVLPAVPCLASACGSSSPPGNPAPAVEDAGPAVICDPPTENLPTDVFCTGLYLGGRSTRYSKEVMPYTPGVTLWSDGAEKQRYLYLPPAAVIDTSDMDVWKFPVGTKAWKEFRFGGKLVETRLFWKQSESNWASGTYVWDDTETAAPLNTSTRALILDSGYEIPTAKDCGKCHHGGADKLLGVEAVALALPTAVGVTLTRLDASGALSHSPVSTASTLPEDATGKAGEALGYLHANCGMPCHSTRGLGEETQLLLRLRAGELLPAQTGGGTQAPFAATATDTYKATVGQVPTTASVAQAFPGAKRIIPGAHDQSLVWLLAHRRGKYQMPPLVSHVVDDAGTQHVSDWIDALAP